METTLKGGMDVLSIGVVIGTLMQYLPPAAALLSIVWTGIQIYNYFSNKRKGK